VLTYNATLAFRHTTLRSVVVSECGLVGHLISYRYVPTSVISSVKLFALQQIPSTFLHTYVFENEDCDSSYHHRINVEDSDGADPLG
jgi:hypothetical protein